MIPSDSAQTAVTAYTGRPRRFLMVRNHDTTKISGEGVVAEGIVWSDGTASVRWLGERPSVVFWDKGWGDAESIHTHNYEKSEDGVAHTEFVFLDPAENPSRGPMIND